MKKVLLTFAIFLFLLLTIFKFETTQSKIVGNSYVLDLVDHSKKLNTIKIVEELATKYNISVSKVVHVKGENYIYANKVFFENNKLEYEEDSSLILSSVPSIAKTSLRTWSNIEEYVEYDGSSFIIGGSDADLNKFKQDIEMFEYEVFITPYIAESSLLIPALQVTLLVLFFVYIFITLLFVEQDKKRLLIMKLHGKKFINSNTKEFKKDLVFLFKIFVIFIVISIPLYLKIHLSPIPFIKFVLPIIIYCLLLVLCLLLIRFIILYVVFKIGKIINLLKGKNSFHGLDTINYIFLFVMKIIMIGGVICFFVILSVLSKDLQVIGDWLPTKDYYYADNVNGFLGSDVSQLDDFIARKEFVNYLETNYNGSYIFKLGNSFIDGKQLDLDTSTEEETEMVVANRNFLELTAFEELKDCEISNACLFIPESYKSMTSKIENYYDKYLKRFMYSKNNQEILNYKVHYYSEDKIYSYDTDYTNNGYFIKPIIFVPIENQTELNVSVYAYQNIIFESSKIDPKHIIDEYYIQQGIDEKRSGIVYNFYDTYSTQIFIEILTLVSLIGSFIIILYLYIIVLNILVTSFIEYNSKVITLKRISGEKKSNVYKEIYFFEHAINILCFIFVVIITLLLNKILDINVIFSITQLLLIGLLLICSFLILTYNVKKHEKKKLVEIIKGKI